MRSVLLDPGALRHEMALQAAMSAPDGLGGATETWQEMATVFALIEPVSAASLTGADQSFDTVTHRITLRRRAGVAAGMRFSRQGRTFRILSVHDPDESGRYLVCRTREGGP